MAPQTEVVLFVAGNYSWVHIIELPENYGFCRAVNEGIRAAKAPYVLLLNNDTEVAEDFVEQMLSAIRRHKNAFSCAARMVQYHDRDRLDDAGNYYCALGWSFARGKGKDIHTYEKEEQIFAACGGAAIYRKKILEKNRILMKNILRIWRIRILIQEPEFTAMKTGMLLKRWFIMWEAAQAVPINQFKTRYSSRNNVYLIYKKICLSDYSEPSVFASWLWNKAFVFLR